MAKTLGALGLCAQEAGSSAPPSGPQSSRPRSLGVRSKGANGTERPRRILLADADARSRDLLRPRLNALASELHEAANGDALEQALLQNGPYQLVVASARLPEPSALQILARIRRNGVTTPFIVVTSTHGNLLRIFVSDAEGTVLSSRIVDEGNLSVLVESILAGS